MFPILNRLPSSLPIPSLWIFNGKVLTWEYATLKDYSVNYSYVFQCYTGLTYNRHSNIFWMKVIFICFYVLKKKKSVIMGYTQCCPNVLESFFGDTKLSIFEIFTLTFGWSHDKDFRTSKSDYSRAEVNKLCCTDQIWPATCYQVNKIVNKILSEYSHVQLFQNYLCLLPCYIGAS